MKSSTYRLHFQFFQQGAADDSNDQAQNHIDNSNPGTENTHKQHQRSQIHHGGRDQEGKVTPMGSPAL